MLQETLESKLALRAFPVQERSYVSHCTYQSVTKWIMGTKLGRIMVLNNFHPLIPGTYDYITFHGKRNFADVIRDVDFQIGRLSWVIQHFECSCNGTYKIKGIWHQKQGSEVRVIPLPEGDYEPWSVGSLWKLKRTREWIFFFSRASRRPPELKMKFFFLLL